MPTASPNAALGLMGLRPRAIRAFKDAPTGNASWLVETDGGGRLVLRRYHAAATPEDIGYEHEVLRYLAREGWVVPEPVGELVQHAGFWFCPTRFVPGAAVAPETAAQRRRRGRDLARLQLALRGLGKRLGQRSGWRAQHRGVTVHTGFSWDGCVRELAQVSPRLGSWAAAAAADAHRALSAIGAAELPVTLIHGDFAHWNVHYRDGRLAGVIDFGLAHLDSRPYELAIARTYRSPEVIDGYRAELGRAGWPLSDLEAAAIAPIYRAFRVDMIAWLIDDARATGAYDLAAIERQLSRTGTTPP